MLNIFTRLDAGTYTLLHDSKQTQNCLLFFIGGFTTYMLLRIVVFVSHINGNE